MTSFTETNSATTGELYHIYSTVQTTEKASGKKRIYSKNMKRFKPLSLAIAIVVVAAAILFHLPMWVWLIVAGGYFVKYVVEGYRGNEEN